MGHLWSAYRDIDAEPVFKPGIYEKFQDTSRPIREMKVTTEEMDRARIERSKRDYCAHFLLDAMKCRRDWFPEIWRCSELKKKYQHCTLEDDYLRLLEYERTKRLMARERKRLAQEAMENLEE